MRAPNHTTIRTAAALLLLASASFGLSSCSTEDTVRNQQGITNVHQGMIERREARQAARDARFNASRESWMN